MQFNRRSRDEDQKYNRKYFTTKPGTLRDITNSRHKNKIY